MMMNRQLIEEPQPVITHAARKALWPALLYIALCSIYIFLSGHLAATSATNAEQLAHIETIKGILFVLVTGALFYLVMYSQWRTIMRQELDLMRQERALLHSERKSVAAICAASVTHDLNNVLMCMSGQLEELAEHQGDDEHLAALRKSIASSIDGLTRLTARIASASSQSNLNERQVIQLDETLDQILNMARRHPAVRRCTLTPPAKSNASLTCNETLFEETVLNLIINAAQAAGPDGKVQIHVLHLDGQLAVEVHDNGPGVPEDQIEEIFTACYTTKPDGTGLGLLTARTFASTHGAEIIVKTSPLGGALFQILFARDL
jgi:signal transduction histidine kinase